MTEKLSADVRRTVEVLAAIRRELAARRLPRPAEAPVREKPSAKRGAA